MKIAKWKSEEQVYVADLREDGSRPIFSLDGDIWTENDGSFPNDAEFHKCEIRFEGGPREGQHVS